MKKLEIKNELELVEAFQKYKELYDIQGNSYILLNNLGTLCSNGNKYELFYIIENDLYIKEPLQDKQFVMAWDNTFKCIKILGFYDAINECLFFSSGRRDGSCYDNYEPISEMPEWAIKAQKMLED